MTTRYAQNGPGPYRTGYVAGNTFQLRKVRYLAVRGRAIFEGDIILGTVREMEAVRSRVEKALETGEEGVFAPDPNLRWPDGVIPFRIAPTLPSAAGERGLAAIRHVEERTPLLFPRRESEKNFLVFRLAGDCFSHVGMRGGEQFLDVGVNCGFGNIVHEICHAAGLWHEHSREDRDKHIRIIEQNVKSGKIEEFRQHVTDGDDVGPYDFGSIMHYPPNAFGRTKAHRTIELVKPNPQHEQLMGQRSALSSGDIEAIRILYG